MRFVFFSFILFLLISGTSTEVTAQSKQPSVFALNMKSLDKNKSKIANNDPAIKAAYKQLLKDADKAMKFGPVSVMEKMNNPPSGDKHDYMSLAPYHWPNPETASGLPYIRKDGQTNPEVKEYKDKEYLPQLCEYVHVLGLAYYFSDDNSYAEHAASLLRVWFLDPATKMNPNLNYGQAIKGVTEGRGAGMIDTRHFVKLIDGIGLLKGSKSWKAADQEGMKKWFTQFLHWMQTSKNGIDEMNAKNNHGAWYDAQRLSMALFIDSIDLAKKIVANAVDRLELQMDEQGSFPAEMVRTISLHYTTFVLDAFFTIANMAENVGINFWKKMTPSGHSLQKGFDAVKPFLANEKEWKGPQIKSYDFEEGFFLLMEGANHFNCKSCKEDVQRLAAEKAARLRINLLY